ncbi:MAG: nucleotidyltransferase family protein [Fretibacterium sp.]|nr:nucleotidyltransferase family protein [Fretibacterium sp.]
MPYQKRPMRYTDAMENLHDPVVGIIAEYNPFHNGHLWHLTEVRRLMPHAPLVMVLSSNFTQRGLPSLVDKWTRTRMALAQGADLVLELPFAFSCNAAPEFSAGAVDILAQTRFVTHLSFGMENPDWELTSILDILIQEPPSFKRNLKKRLSSGHSYPKALARALESELPGSASFLASPNNSLALSYLLHTRKKGYALIPLPVLRRGAGYHAELLGPLPSATAVRKAIAHGAGKDELDKALPSATLALLAQAQTEGRLCLGTEKLWRLLQSLLMRTSPLQLRSVAGMDEGLEHLFLRHAEAESYEAFIGRCLCARYTKSRLQRQVARLLVNVERWNAAALSRLGPPYIRVLGFGERGRHLLRERNSSSTPFISRLPAAQKLGPLAKSAADMEFRASKLYELLLPTPDPKREERSIPLSESTTQMP